MWALCLRRRADPGLRERCAGVCLAARIGLLGLNGILSLRQMTPAVQRQPMLCSPAAVGFPTKPFSSPDENVLKQTRRSDSGSKNGGDHVGTHPQPYLPQVSQERPFGHGNPGGKAMTEIVTALFVFFSISVFLAHAFDAYRVR